MLTKNSKIAKNEGAWNWSIMAVKTCPMAGDCKNYCYGTKGHYTLPCVPQAQEARFMLSKTKAFVDLMDAEIKRKRNLKSIRIHGSGDFYSQEYLDKWVEIARRNPAVRFYCYTKSLHLNWGQYILLTNTKMIQSFGGRLDFKIDRFKPHARIFKNLQQLERAGFVDCSQDDNLASNEFVNNIGLIEH